MRQQYASMNVWVLPSLAPVRTTTRTPSRTRSSYGGMSPNIHVFHEVSPRGDWGLSAGLSRVTLFLQNVLLQERRVRPMNAAEAQEVKNLLMQSNDQYRQLSERHHLLDDRLHQLTERHFLSATEQLEEVTLKKQKLALKDQMERIALDYARAHLRAS